MYKQKGFTFWSLTFTVAVIALVALLTMKLFPAYAEFFAVKRAINRLSQENLEAMDRRQVMDSFEKYSTIDDIHSIKPADLQIKHSGSGKVIVEANYEVVVPLVANASALLEFHASTDDAAKSKILP